MKQNLFCKTLFLFSALAISSKTVYAQSATAGSFETLKAKMSQVLTKLESMTKSSTAPACATPPKLAGSAECVSKYQALYSKSDVNVTMAFGYADTRPNPSLFSGVAAHNFMQSLIHACPNDEADPAKLCGFTRDAEDNTLFSKAVLGPYGNLHQFKIHVVSAVDPEQTGLSEDDLNKSPAQKIRSAKASEAFQRALKNDDVVLYEGPSRNCAGPDFNPPVLTSTQNVDDAYYQKNHAGLNSMKQSLQSSAHHPQAVALFASDSKSCFAKAISTASPNTALITANTAFSNDPVDVMNNRTFENAEKNFLDGLMNLRCDDGFVASLQTGNIPQFELTGWGVKAPNVAQTQ